MNGVCAAKSGYGYFCTLDEGHDGAHVATDTAYKVLDTWYVTEEAKR